MEDRTRPLTDAERSFLRSQETAVLGGDPAIAGCATMGAGCLTVPACLIAFLAMSGRPRSTETKLLTAAGLFCLFWIGWYLLLWKERKKRLEQTREAREVIQRDIEGGVAQIHRFRAKAVLLAYSQQHKGRNYFVQLDDGRVMFLSGWGTPRRGQETAAFGPDEKGFPSTEFELATGPESRLILDVVGCGEYLRPEDEFEMANGKAKLKVGEYVKTPWEKIRQTYG